MLRLALLFSFSIPYIFSSKVERSSAPVDSVSCSLEEYQTLFRRAYLQELKNDTEEEKRQLRHDYERKERKLQVEKNALNSSSTTRAERAQVLPGNWQLLNHTASGSYHFGPETEERSMATYEFSLDFRLFEDEWTAIPIIDAQSVVADWVVTRAGNNGSKWEEVELGHNTLLVLKRREVAEEAQAWQDHTFVTNVSGHYRIRFRLFTHVRSNRNLFTLQLNLLYPLAHTQLRLHHDASSALIKELSVEPAAFFDISKGTNFSDIHIRLPSSPAVEVKWRVQVGAHSSKSKSSASALQGAGQLAGEEEQAEETEPAQATVLHDSLHSIADGILQSTHTFRYQLDSAAQSLSSVEIVFSNPVRISSVLAHGMQMWRNGPAKNTVLPGQSGDAPPFPGNVSGTSVVVAFKSSVISKEVIVKINSEQEFDVEAGLVALPVAICQGVLRQTGTIAVVKVANVEVYEQSAAGIASIGSDDVPSYIRGSTARPIVLAYKYLSPRYAVAISVLHHEELRTLEAVVDTALHQVLIVDTQMMHTFSMVMQNMQRQYMEVRGIPASATLWSLKVNSLDTKPVRGRQGALMVPLLVGPQGTAEGGGVPKTSIALAWLSTREPLGENGTLDLFPPQVDVPISALSSEIQFPDGYLVNFTGSLTKVDKFSQRQPTTVNYETGQDIVVDNFDYNSKALPNRGSSGSKAGVKAKIPKAGTRHLFEKLLVVNGSATLSVAYSKPVQHERKRWLSWGWLDGIA